MRALNGTSARIPDHSVPTLKPQKEEGSRGGSDPPMDRSSNNQSLDPGSLTNYSTLRWDQLAAQDKARNIYSKQAATAIYSAPWGITTNERPKGVTTVSHTILRQGDVWLSNPIHALQSRALENCGKRRSH